MDIVDTATRSRMMARVTGRHTGPELKLRRALHGRGFRFRLHVGNLPGRPDIVLARWNVAIQVQGCFWHRHVRCRLASTPATRTEFWTAKFAANMRRDEGNLRALRQAEWRVAVVWECGLRATFDERLVDELEDWIKDAHAPLLELPHKRVTDDAGECGHTVAA